MMENAPSANRSRLQKRIFWTVVTRPAAIAFQVLRKVNSGCFSKEKALRVEAPWFRIILRDYRSKLIAAHSLRDIRHGEWKDDRIGAVASDVLQGVEITQLHCAR